MKNSILNKIAELSSSSGNNASNSPTSSSSSKSLTAFSKSTKKSFNSKSSFKAPKFNSGNTKSMGGDMSPKFLQPTLGKTTLRPIQPTAPAAYGGHR